MHLHMLKLYSRSLPLNTVNAKFFRSTQKKLLAKMWIKLPNGKFPCSFGRVAFANNKFFITHLCTGSWGTRFVLVNLNKQSSYLNCYLKIITSNAYLISAIILHCSDMESGLYFIVGLHRLLNEVLHVYTRRL